MKSRHVVRPIQNNVAFLLSTMSAAVATQVEILTIPQHIAAPFSTFAHVTSLLTVMPIAPVPGTTRTNRYCPRTHLPPAGPAQQYTESLLRIPQDLPTGGDGDHLDPCSKCTATGSDESSVSPLPARRSRLPRSKLRLRRQLSHKRALSH